MLDDHQMRQWTLAFGGSSTLCSTTVRYAVPRSGRSLVLQRTTPPLAHDSGYFVVGVRGTLLETALLVGRQM
jgi:hypothetical protein